MSGKRQRVVTVVRSRQNESARQSPHIVIDATIGGDERVCVCVRLSCVVIVSEEASVCPSRLVALLLQMMV